MTKDEELIERAATIAYRVCAETRHVTLGDKAANAIRTELQPADRLEAIAQPVVGAEGLAKAKAVNLILAELLAPLIPDLFERIEVGNRVCSLILAALAAPSPVVGDREAIGRVVPDIAPEWCMKMAELEEGCEIGAGRLDHPLRTPAPVMESREVIARIIDPYIADDGSHVSYMAWQLALAKADAILSLSTPVVGGISKT